MNYLEQAEEDLRREEEADKKRQLIAGIGQALAAAASARGLARVGKSPDLSQFQNISEASSRALSDAVTRRRKAQAEEQEAARQKEESRAQAIANAAKERVAALEKQSDREARAEEKAQDRAFQKAQQEASLRQQKELAEASRGLEKEKLAAQVKKEDTGTKAQQAMDVEFAKEEARTKSEGGLATSYKNLDLLKSSQAKLHASKEGGLIDRAQGALTQMFPTAASVVAPETVKTQEDIETAVQGSLRPILGGQFAAVEAARILKNAYNPALGDDVNAEKLKPAIQEIENIIKNKEAASEYFRKNKTLDGFIAPSSEPVSPSTSPDQEAKRRRYEELKAKYAK